MFAKLVVLILVFGASGVGVLSIRQSRLQAVHEMAESRHRIRSLGEQQSEIQTMIVRSCTPQRVIELLEDRGWYTPASQSPAQFQAIRGVLEDAGLDPAPEMVGSGLTAQGAEELPDGSLVWTLDDGSRVVFVQE